MRILMAASVADSEVTGVPRQMRALGREFTRQGHEVAYQFLPLQARGPGSARSLWFSLWILPQLLRFAVRQTYDVFLLHSSDGWPYGLARRLARGLVRTPYVMTSHGLEHRFWEVFRAEERAGRLTLSARHKAFTRAVRLPIVTLAVRTCDRLICLTGAERRDVVRRRWKSEGEIAAIFNGVGPEYFRGQAALEAPLSRLLWIGPWTWNKGRHLLINAFPPLAERHPRLRLTLIGTALPEGVVLADFPSAIRPRIRVVERMPPEALPQELVAHDLFVFPSLFEGGPLSLLEAMAAGLAVVTSNCYAMAEIVTAGVDGLLVRPGDAAALADAIGHLLDHPAEAQRLGRAARARARELSWATAAQRTLDVLQRARGAAGEASLAGMAAEPERK